MSAVYTIEPDADGEPTLWRRDSWSGQPHSIARRANTPTVLWELAGILVEPSTLGLAVHSRIRGCGSTVHDHPPGVPHA